MILEEKLKEYNCNIDEGKLALSFDFDKDVILRIVVGFGGRLCLEKTMSNALPTVRVVVWEPDDLMYDRYCQSNDIREIVNDKKISIVVGKDTAFLERILRDNINESNVHHMKIVVLGEYSLDGNVYVKQLVEIVKKIVQQVANTEGARKRFSKLPCRNMIYTIKTLNKNYVINQLFECIQTRDIPVIIVSAGPSLMKNCCELKRAKGKALIIAVAHSIKTLNRENIPPDLVAVTDPEEAGFIDCDNSKKYILLSSIYADKTCRKGYDGRIIYYGFTSASDIFHTKRTEKEEYAELDTGSVSTDVFSLLVAAGFKRIILVGQDLAYDGSGNSHTEGEKDANFNKGSSEVLSVEGITGELIESRRDWIHFKEYFEKRINTDKMLHVIDSTEGGALIRGTDIMTLTDAIERYCDKEYPIEQWINGMSCGNEEERDYIDYWFDRNIEILKIASHTIRDAVEVNNSIRSIWNDKTGWDARFAELCSKYDQEYSYIIDNEENELLRFYCTEAIQNYIEHALAVEGDENTEKRLFMECELFNEMLISSDELIEYMEGMHSE